MSCSLAPRGADRGVAARNDLVDVRDSPSALETPRHVRSGPRSELHDGPGPPLSPSPLGGLVLVVLFLGLALLLLLHHGLAIAWAHHLLIVEVA